MSTGGDGEECVLWIVPGPHLGDLGQLLQALPALHGRCGSVRIPELAGRVRAGVVLVDAEALSAEDFFDLQRFVARGAPVRVMLVGEDASRRGVRGLLRAESVRWLSWPPDVEDLRAIAAFAARSAAALGDASDDEDADDSARAEALPSERRMLGKSASTAAAPQTDSGRRARTPGSNPLLSDLAEIERVLGTHRVEHEEALLEEREEIEEPESIEAVRLEEPIAVPSARPPPTVERASAAPSAPVERASAALSTRPPESFRAQVADLADIAQRIELTLLGLREAHEALDEGADASIPMDDLAREVARLVQFARTLGYLVAPPGRGSQVFDLTEMLELFLTEMRTAGPEAPRCLLRSSGALTVRSDRQLLSQAFDAFFFTARSAAGRGEIVRVQARRDEESDPASARVSIDFPAGKLAGIPTASILEPYGLRRVYPDLGPNALSAAVQIIEGQGGHCRLEPQHRGRMEWTITLPLAHAGLPTANAATSAANGDESSKAGGAPDFAGEMSRAVRAEDPFA